MEIPIARQVAVWKTEIDRRAGVFILRRYFTDNCIYLLVRLLKERRTLRMRRRRKKRERVNSDFRISLGE